MCFDPPSPLKSSASDSASPRLNARKRWDFAQTPPQSPCRQMRTRGLKDEGTPPATPRRHELHTEFMVPPAPGVKTKRPDLLQALRLRSVTHVEEVLKGDPDAATMPFFEHGCDSPLHVAVQKSCCPEIIQLLLRHGACVNDINVRGQTPLQVNEKLRADAYAASFHADFDQEVNVKRDAIAEVLRAASAEM